MKKSFAIIIDEIHERTLLSDMILGILKQNISKYPLLKVIATSATIDADKFCSFLNNCQKLEISGEAFPVEVIYKP